MSIGNILEVGFTLLGIGAVLGLWIYAARHSEPRDVMLVLATALASSRRDRDR